VAAAWELWLVRLLSRFSLTVPPALVTVALALLGAGFGLLGLAAVHAFGDAAAANVRELPGFFPVGSGALTNATHFVYLCALPLLAGVTMSLIQVLGLASFDPMAALQDRSVWQGLGFSGADLVLTHEVLPRLPVLAVSWAPTAGLLTLTALVPAERRLVLVLVGIAGATELLRVGVAAYRVTRPVERVGRTGVRAVRRLLGAALAGGVAGSAVRALLPWWSGGSSDPSVAWMSTWVVEHAAWAAAGCVAVSVAGAVLLIMTVAHDGAFRRVPGSAPQGARGVAGWLTGAGFPVVGPGALMQVWGSADVRWAVAAMVALPASGVDPAVLPRQVVGVALVAALMGFCVTRLTATGPSSGLMRLRHHVELGASPARITGVLALAALAAGAPMLAAVAVLLVVAAGAPVTTAIGVVLLAPVATLVADTVVAQPGEAGLTETRLLVLALLQSLLVMGGWLLFTLHPAAGWPLPFVLTGVVTWLVPRRLTLWLPRTRP
jgi:hypothetical protein